MAISQAFLGEFDHEMANTRKALERVPDPVFNWKPHEKSMSMGALAGHIASIPQYVLVTLSTPKFDFRADGASHRPPEMKTRAEVLAVFDKLVPEARAAIARANDQEMMTPWTLSDGPNVIFTLPRAAVLRSMVMNHMIHHRAQLGVYFRLNNIPVPALYGPSADEGR